MISLARRSALVVEHRYVSADGGSNRAFFKDNPPPPGARGADYRQLLQGHPYIRGLHTAGDTDERAARFIDRAEEHGGISLQVVENTGEAGDVILLHPLVLHVATPNTSQAPRFLLSGGIDLPSMWAASPLRSRRFVEAVACVHTGERGSAPHRARRDAVVKELGIQIIKQSSKTVL